MRAALDKWINSVWYQNVEPPWYLRSLEPLYRYFSSKPAAKLNRSIPIPIVVIGNISVGGTGKTPLVISLCQQLQATGYKPAVISRGYGRSSKGLHNVSTNDSSLEAGDEALLIKSETGVPVLVDTDRLNAAMQFTPEEVDIILADDGLQNNRLPRDMEICVVDGQRLFGNGHLLPAGPLRQPVSRLGRVNHIVLNGDSDQMAEFNDWLQSQKEISPPSITAMQLLAHNIQPLNQEQVAISLEDWKGRKVNAVAAIGNPERFFHSLEQLGIKVSPHIFPDHHRYTSEDFKDISGLPIIMTAKDAIKCKSLNLTDAWVLNIKAKFDPETTIFTQLEKLIQHYQASI